MNRETDNKPTAEQVAWVFDMLLEAQRNGATYRYMIYDMMGFDNTQYFVLLRGLDILNQLPDIEEANREPRDDDPSNSVAVPRLP